MSNRTLFLALCIVLLCAFGLWSRHEKPEERGGRDTTFVRIAHWYLEPGMRETIDTIIRDYEQLKESQGQRVRVIQMPIPKKVYPTWSKAQLIGGTAPEILMTMNATDDYLAAQYLVPLRSLIERPNPYNVGTPLEHTRWRDTFLDGMAISGFNFTLLEHYSVPFSTLTVRGFVNTDLLRDLANRAGFAELSSDNLRFQDYKKLGRALRELRDPGVAVIAGAGGEENMRFLREYFFRSQTQRRLEVDTPFGDMRPRYHNLMSDFLKGTWSLDNKEVLSGLSLMRDLGDLMPSSFLQLRNEDAVFQFVQGRAVILFAYSSYARILEHQIAGRFPVKVVPIPMPGKGDPEYGMNVVGALSEADAAPIGYFGLVAEKPSAQREAAIDFLHYLTSQKVNSKFARLSGWLPAVVGAEIPADLAPFTPVFEDGFPKGFDLTMTDSAIRSAVQRKEYLLYGAGGGARLFLDSLIGDFRNAATEALRVQDRDVREAMTRGDSVLIANRRLGTMGSAHSVREKSLGFDIDSQQRREWEQLCRRLGDGQGQK